MPSTVERGSALTTVERTLSDGRTIAYTDSGDPDGEPVVVHHGTPGSRLFAAVLGEAAADEGVRLIVPDRPGYGRSSPAPSDWTWSDWRADLYEVLDAESITRAGVVGFSGGGPFALAAAGDRVSRIGLVSSVVPPAENGLTRLADVPFALPALFRITGRLARIVGPNVVTGLYTERSLSAGIRRAVADDYHESIRQGAGAATRETRSFATEALELDRVSAPVRAWHGTADENTAIEPVESLVQALDGTLETCDTDHLGTLLDRRREIFRWFGAE